MLHGGAEQPAFKSLFQGRVGGVGNAIKNKENRTVKLEGGEKMKNFLFLYLYNVGDNERYPEAILTTARSLFCKTAGPDPSFYPNGLKFELQFKILTLVFFQEKVFRRCKNLNKVKVNIQYFC